MLCPPRNLRRAGFENRILRLNHKRLVGPEHEQPKRLEYKPKEPRAHCYMARMADTLLLAQETGQPNVGITIDTGHAFVGGEVVSESIVLAKRHGDCLFHMHFNDNHVTTDDDTVVGTVHSVCYPETLYWHDRCGYAGWLSMDQDPYREDAATAAAQSCAASIVPAFFRCHSISRHVLWPLVPEVGKYV